MDGHDPVRYTYALKGRPDGYVKKRIRSWLSLNLAVSHYLLIDLQDKVHRAHV